MKTFYYSISCMLWLAACSSPAAQNTTQNVSQDITQITKETTATVDTGSALPVSSPRSDYEPAIYKGGDQTVPPYGLKKVEAFVKKIKSVDSENGDDYTEVLDPKLYASLSLPEKFTYHMVHPESYSQNCDILPIQENEDQRIFGHFGNIFGEYYWSERQLNFLRKGRDTVMQLMKVLIEKDKSVGKNFKEAIVEINGTELIPCLIDCYKVEKKDHYILTLLMLLMKNNNYPEFMNSTSYKKLYGQEEGQYAAYLVYNKGNEDLIIQRATNFYNGLHTK